MVRRVPQCSQVGDSPGNTTPLLIHACSSTLDSEAYRQDPCLWMNLSGTSRISQIALSTLSIHKRTPFFEAATRSITSCSWTDSVGHVWKWYGWKRLAASVAYQPRSLSSPPANLRKRHKHFRTTHNNKPKKIWELNQVQNV